MDKVSWLDKSAKMCILLLLLTERQMAEKCCLYSSAKVYEKQLLPGLGNGSEQRALLESTEGS